MHKHVRVTFISLYTNVCTCAHMRVDAANIVILDRRIGNKKKKKWNIYSFILTFSLADRSFFQPLANCENSRNWKIKLLFFLEEKLSFIYLYDRIVYQFYQFPPRHVLKRKATNFKLTGINNSACILQSSKKSSLEKHTRNSLKFS